MGASILGHFLSKPKGQRGKQARYESPSAEIDLTMSVVPKTHAEVQGTPRGVTYRVPHPRSDFGLSVTAREGEASAINKFTGPTVAVGHVFDVPVRSVSPANDCPPSILLTLTSHHSCGSTIPLWSLRGTGDEHVENGHVDSPTVAHVAPRLRFLPPAPLRFQRNFRVESCIRRNASRGATSPTLNHVHSTGLALPTGGNPRICVDRALAGGSSSPITNLSQ